MGEILHESNDSRSHGIGMYRHMIDMKEAISRPISRGASVTVTIFFIILFVGAVLSAHWITPIFTSDSLKKAILGAQSTKIPPNKYGIPLSCANRSAPQTCAANDRPLFNTEVLPGKECPEYFRWIHEDLGPWQKTGITKEMVERANGDFRLLIIKGKVYVEKYRGVFQTRDIFTIWGIVQLLKFYPGKLPDLDLMFGCGDVPLILKSDYQGVNAASAPPLFHYCKDDQTLDIVFPDWSFWGWPEINIKPWVSLKKELAEGNKRIKWTKRKPYAYWKGNIYTGEGRQDLFKCNPRGHQDWNARIYDQNWDSETKSGFKDSNLASQCTYRYKIYIEGNAWSVSEKYILACDSMTLLINPRYYDIITRGLRPLTHYWPIRNNAKCKSIKFAVDWGNKHNKEAEKIGKAGSKFIQEKLTMSQVYDYMFHVLNEYAKLLKYQPTLPPKAVEVCSETMACHVEGLERIYLVESMVKSPASAGPCTLPPPYDPSELQSFLKRKQELTKKVEGWEESGNVRKVKLENF